MSESAEQTPWAVRCREHGQVFLTREAYRWQMDRPDAFWTCPRCGQRSSWDDDNYETAGYSPEEEPR